MNTLVFFKEVLTFSSVIGFSERRLRLNAAEEEKNATQKLAITSTRLAFYQSGAHSEECVRRRGGKKTHGNKISEWVS